MNDDILAKITVNAVIKNQYQKQLARLKNDRIKTDKIEAAAKEAMRNLPRASTGSLVIYGDPQSGKTEMMICLTARLLDAGHRIIVHLMNDSVDLLAQNLDRFRLAALAPAPRNAGELAGSALLAGQSAILFCKKNTNNLRA